MAISLFRRRTPAIEPTEIAVVHEGAAFRVSVRRRPAARRMTLRVSGISGEIVLTLPQRAAFKTAEAFVAGHAGWIAARVARLPEKIDFRPDSVVPLRGVPHRIVHEPMTRGATVLRDGPEPAIVVRGEVSSVPGRVRRFLVAEAGRDLTEAVTRYCAALGTTARRVTLRDTRSRWGSCSSTGALNFSWRLIMAPPLVLDYLAAHEVAHLKEMNHSSRFWAVTRGLCPKTDEAEAWLKRNGTSLHRYG